MVLVLASLSSLLPISVRPLCGKHSAPPQWTLGEVIWHSLFSLPMVCTKRQLFFFFTVNAKCCHCHLGCVVTLANAAGAAVQSASTKTFFSICSISRDIYWTWIVTVPSLKVCSCRLPLCYDCCPTYWPNISYFFLLLFLHFALKTLLSKLHWRWFCLLLCSRKQK